MSDSSRRTPWPADKLVGYARNYARRSGSEAAQQACDAAAAVLSSDVVERPASDEGMEAYRRAEEMALESIRLSLGETHTDYLLILNTPRITKEEALRKYEPLLDSRVRATPPSPDDRKRSRDLVEQLVATGLLRESEADTERTWCERSFAAARALAESAPPAVLKEFALQTGHFTWPASFGQSPYEEAFSMAALLGFVSDIRSAQERVDNPRANPLWCAFDCARLEVYEANRRRIEQGVAVAEEVASELSEEETADKRSQGR